MEGRLEISQRIHPSLCDCEARLSIPAAFGLFMDIATLHAESLGVGAKDLGAKGLFWLTVRTRARFFERPRMSRVVTLETWPEPPARLRCNRCYRLRRGEEVLALGKTEWAVLDTATGALRPAAEVFPRDLAYWPETVLPEPFLRMKDDFEGEPYAATKVASVDIDLGGHMNNVAYVRALLGTFTNRELKERAPRELELCYRASCYEGDRLLWQKRQEGEALLLRAALEDGKTVLLASMK